MIDFIKKLGLDLEKENALIGAYNQEKEKTTKGADQLKADFLEKEKEYKTKLDNFKDYEQLKEQLGNFENKIAESTTKYEALEQQKVKDLINYEIEKGLILENAQHRELLMPTISRDNIKLENGVVTGVKEAIAASKEIYNDLYIKKPIITGSTPAPATQTVAAFNPKNMSVSELAQNWDKVLKHNKK